jgi:hypothetical protein
MTIEPDTKDWTWVAERPCQECGLDIATMPPSAFAGLVRATAAVWYAVLTGPDNLRQRPAPDVWSALEYGCHVRDVLRLADYRLQLMLTVDDPSYPSWDQDAAAVTDRYDLQDPAAVAAALRDIGEVFSARLEQVSGDDWNRPGTRDDGTRFTVDSFARYNIHDMVHHRYDVTGTRHVGSPAG